MAKETEEQKEIHKQLSAMLAMRRWTEAESNAWEKLLNSYPVENDDDKRVVMWL